MTRRSLLQRLRSFLLTRRSARQERASAVSPDRARKARASVSTAETDHRTPAAPADPLEVLHQLDGSRPEQMERAIAALRAAAGTALERRALDACQSAHARGAASPELRCLAAELLARRGQSGDALRLLAGLRETAAWLLEAELCAEQGQHERALALSERALAYDIDAPGALLRVRRWNALPGTLRSPGADQTTLLGRESPATTLRIVAEAGRGGAATVYQAEDDVLRRHVALKVYHDVERFREHLLREARLAIRFAGPAVIRVFDVDAQAGWICTEWAGGGSLKERLAARAGTSYPGFAWCAGLVGAVAELHRAGYVHGDLKPANILFRSQGAAKLSDFGLAVRVGSKYLGASAGYVSPERAAGKPAQPGDDVYALGRVLEQLVTCAEGLGGSSKAAIEPWRTLARRASASDRPVDARELLGLLPGGTA